MATNSVDRGRGKGAAKKGSSNAPPANAPQAKYWGNVPPAQGAPYWYQPSGKAAWAPPPPPQVASGTANVWAAAMWPQKGKGKGFPVVPMVPWAPQAAPTKGAPGQGKGYGKGPPKEKATFSFCQREFWYASTNESWDSSISVTGIDCSKGKYKGCVFCQTSLEKAEETARKFNIGRVHKINVAAMFDHYGKNGVGGCIWTHGPTTIDVSDLPEVDRNFVRPEYIESFPVRPRALPSGVEFNAAGSEPNYSHSPEIIFNPLADENASEDDEIPTAMRTSQTSPTSAAALANKLATALKSQDSTQPAEPDSVVPAPIPAVSSILASPTVQEGAEGESTAPNKDEKSEDLQEEAQEEAAAATTAEKEESIAEKSDAKKDSAEKKKKKKKKDQKEKSGGSNSLPGQSQVDEIERPELLAELDPEAASSPSFSRGKLLQARPSITEEESLTRQLIRIESVETVGGKLEVATPKAGDKNTAKTPPPWRSKAGPPSPAMSPVKLSKDSEVSDSSPIEKPLN